MTTPSHDEIDVRATLAEGRQRFLDLDLKCGAGALVPRPETELLATMAIRRALALERPLRVVDMCCGVGNLACAIARHVPTATVWAADLTDDCVAWARRNVETLGLQDRVTVAQGDLFGGLENLGLEGTVDLVVCNPPYISTARLADERAPLLELEPREAFEAGPYGLTFHQRISAESPRFLTAGGWLMMEFGLGQERQISIVFARGRRFGPPEFALNAAGAPRVVAAQYLG